jgi:hypothetical protein
MVQEADTVADPRTVMIHSHHALIADWAVVTPRWFNILASFTVLILKEIHAQSVSCVAHRVVHITDIDLGEEVAALVQVHIISSVGFMLWYHLGADKWTDVSWVFKPCLNQGPRNHQHQPGIKY